MWILLTAVLSALLTRLQIRMNIRLRLTAPPRADRWHSIATPSSGGLAIFLSCAAAYWMVCPGRYPRIAAAATALWIYGFLDDRLRLSPPLKLAVQTAAAAFVVSGGLVFAATPWHPANMALSMFWIVMISNALNLIDNMDGLCAGAVIIISLFRYGLLRAEGRPADADLCAIIAAAFAGFLVFNYHPARIFMGDCGSLPAGFALGALTLAGPAPEPEVVLAGFCYPALTFAYPIFDTALVSVLRKMAGRPITQGGRDHSSHRLAAMGIDQRRVVWMLWLLTAFGCGFGMLIHLVPDALFPAAAMLGGLFGLVAWCLRSGRHLSAAPGGPKRFWDAPAG